jgi:Histidine phosphatase superfamily (branch 1)
MRYADSLWQVLRAGRLNELLDQYDETGLLRIWNRRRVKTRITAPAISSDLKRAVETAALFTGAPAQAIETSPLFRETPLARFRAENLRLPLIALLALVRFGWFTGWMQCGEGRRETLARVRRAADELERRALRDREIALFSHGFFLWLLSRELCARGWVTEKRGPFRYLETAEFRPADLALTERRLLQQTRPSGADGTS